MKTVDHTTFLPIIRAAMTHDLWHEGISHTAIPAETIDANVRALLTTLAALPPETHRDTLYALAGLTLGASSVHFHGGAFFCASCFCHDTEELTNALTYFWTHVTNTPTGATQ